MISVFFKCVCRFLTYRCDAVSALNWNNFSVRACFPRTHSRWLFKREKERNKRMHLASYRTAHDPNKGAGRGSPRPRLAAAHRRQLKRRGRRWHATTTQFGAALHSAFSGLSDVGTGKPFAGVAPNKMRRPGAQTPAQALGLKTFLGHFHAHREPQQSASH